MKTKIKNVNFALNPKIVWDDTSTHFIKTKLVMIQKSKINTNVNGVSKHLLSQKA